MRGALIGALALLLLPPPAAGQPIGQKKWSVKVASWNLLNLSVKKAYTGGDRQKPRKKLLERYRQIIADYDVVFVQEVLQDGKALTDAIASGLTGFDCARISTASGLQGRQERYGVCYRASGIQISAVVDYAASGMPKRKAIDGSQQPARYVWERPPYSVTLVYTPPQGQGQPITLTVYDNHFKPQYAKGSRPPGTPSTARRNAAVANQLRSLQDNLGAGGHRVVLGDLNAGCTYYPQKLRKKSFGPGWIWLIGDEAKTNVAIKGRCAYDRLILEDTLKPFVLDHGVRTMGIPEKDLLDGVVLSDHYLVWVEFGEEDKGPVAMAIDQGATQSAGVISGKRDARVSGNVPPNKKARTTGQVAIVPHVAGQSFGGNAAITLRDVRGRPTPVTVGPGGALPRGIAWPRPKPGLYNIVFDANADGRFRRSDGDFANHEDQADALVVSDDAGHNALVTLGDDGRVRELFAESRAHNIYALAKGLPVGEARPKTVDVYVVSRALLPDDFQGWDHARGAGNVRLLAVAAPVLQTHGEIPLPFDPKRPGDTAARRRTVPTQADGALFTVAWSRPSIAFNLPVVTPAQPEDVVQDFSDHYGTAYNVVIDVDGDGIFDGSDLVDTYDIGDMRRWFDRSGEPLGPAASGDPAVSEYKEFLDARLALSPPLPANDTWDPETEDASFRYLCAGTVSKRAFQLVEDSADVGFRVVDEVSYVQARAIARGAVFGEAELDDVTFSGAPCVRAEGVELAEATFDGDTTLVSSGAIAVTGDLTHRSDGTACLVSEDGLRVLPSEEGVIDIPVADGRTFAFVVGVASYAAFTGWGALCDPYR